MTIDETNATFITIDYDMTGNVTFDACIYAYLARETSIEGFSTFWQSLD